MFIKRNPQIYLWAFLAILAFLGNMAQAQSAEPLVVTHDQIQSLMPDESELQGFVRLQLAKFEPSNDMTGGDSDYVNLNRDPTQGFPGHTLTSRSLGTVSRIGRRYVSTDNRYWITIEIYMRDTSDAAKEELANFRQGSQAGYRPGTLSSSSQIGDESCFSGENALLFRSGRMMAYVNGALTWSASHQDNVPPFPALALEAVAYQILLRASEQPAITGVMAQTARVNINSYALPKNALMLGKQVYVPVAEFAKAMGLTSQWNAKTGALTLSGAGHKTVALTAGSTAAKVGGMAAAALKVPVLKQAGQPVMTLDDLLTLTGGRVTGRTGNTVQVKA